MDMEDLFDELGYDDPEDTDWEHKPVGEWVYEQFDMIPAQGESFTWHRLKVTVESIDPPAHPQAPHPASARRDAGRGRGGVTTWIYVLLMLVLLCGSAFFSASEMALSSANRMRLASAAEEGNRAAGIACKVIDKYENALSAILIGNNLCNIGSDSIVTVLGIALLGEKYNGWVSVLITLCMTAIIIVFCESAPKIAAKKNANRFSMTVAPFVRFLMIVLSPVIFLVSLLIRLITLPLKDEHSGENTEEEAAAELQSIIETVEDEGVIDEDRSELLRSALDFSEIAVMDVMTARVDVEALDIDDDWRELLLSGEDLPYSRIPVYEDSIDNVIGVLYLNRFYKRWLDDPDADIRSNLMKPLYIYKTVKLPDVLAQLRKNQQHLAVVTDEYGGTLGIVTLEDVLEELVGDHLGRDRRGRRRDR